MTNLFAKWKINLEICDETRARMTTTLLLIEKRAQHNTAHTLVMRDSLVVCGEKQFTC